MLVKHNYAYSKGLQSPLYVGYEDRLNYKLEGGSLYVENSHTSFAKILIDEDYHIDDTETNYFLGFHGKLEGYCALRSFSKLKYIKVKNKGNFYYIEATGDKVSKPLHVEVIEDSVLRIDKVGCYKGEIPDIYLPNINTLPKDKQPLLPPEGHYKEITPL